MQTLPPQSTSISPLPTAPLLQRTDGGGIAQTIGSALGSQ
jgi:hypothetical protein